MAERVEYEGSILESKDNDRAVQQASGLVASAENFAEGTGEPLYADVQGDAWEDEGGSDEYEVAEYEGNDSEAYSEPAAPSLLEQYQQAVAGLNQADLNEVWQGLGPEVRASISAEFDAQQGLQRQQQQFEMLDSRARYAEQSAALAEQQDEDQSTAGRENGLAYVEQLAADAHVQVDPEAVLDAAVEAVETEAALMRHQGVAVDEDWMRSQFAEVSQWLVDNERAWDQHREMLVSTRMGLGPYPGGSWVRPT